MISLLLHFPAGHYHATPWGHHVNEGLVEWPPSPWRLLRALVATGYAKLGWPRVPEDGRELLEVLASELPVYRLPPGSGAHSRHYVPVHEGKKITTTRVIDAFARLGPGVPLSVTWPVDASLRARELLSEIVARLGYLGRAESLVAVRAVGEHELPPWPETRADVSNAPGYEPISLLAPMTREQYASWRVNSTSGEASQDRRRRKSKGADAAYPEDLIAALSCDTGWLQENGWSDPPGSKRVLYWRPAGALDARATPRRAARTTPGVDTALLALASDARRREVLPLFTRALPQAELLHRSLVSFVSEEESHCPELTGLDEQGVRLEGHRHAHFLPLDLDGDGRLDHFLIHAPMGLGSEAQAALRRLRRTWTKGGHSPLYVTLAGLGVLREFERLGGAALAELATARTWRSRTPFVPPRHIKSRRHTLEDQVRAELESRGLPQPVRVEVNDVREQRFYRFVRARRHPDRGPPTTRCFDLSIELPESVLGPLALGYGSHFGLGLFAAE